MAVNNLQGPQIGTYGCVFHKKTRQSDQDSLPSDDSTRVCGVVGGGGSRDFFVLFK